MCFSNGAIAAKLSGAGGGGFLFLFVPFDKKFEVILCLKEIGGEVMNLTLAMNGAEAWT